MDIEYVPVVPDTSMMRKAGQTGYSFSEIVSELVDNSIDAMIENEKLIVNINIEPDTVEVIDNAVGMNKKELNEAAILAKCKKEAGKLGLYGLGLKTSCVALGGFFEVTSLKKGESSAYKTWWDEEDWEQRNEWALPMETLSETPEELLESKHGTIVKIKKLRYKAGNKINQLRGDIGKRFAPFINKKIVEISVNDQPCKALTPDLMEDSKRDVSIKTSHGLITGWVGLLKNSSQRGYYGFDTFRFGRMITCYDKIGFNPHPAVARVVGELHMNHIPVTANKREWEKDTPEYEEAVILIQENIKDIVSWSRKLAVEKRVGVVEKNKLEQFKEGLAEAIKSDELKEYTRPEREVSSSNVDEDNLPSEKNIKNMEEKTKDDKNFKMKIEIEKRDEQTIPDKGSVEPQDTGRKRIPKKTHLVSKNQIIVKGRIFDYHHEWSHLGENGPIYEKYYDKDARKLEVFTNMDFPAVHVTEDRAYYAFTQIVEAIAMIMIEEANADFDKFDDIRQILLRESAKYVAELRD